MRIRPALRRWGDGALAAAFAAALLVELVEFADGLDVATAACGLLAAAALAFRQRAPLVVFAVSMTALHVLARIAPGFEEATAVYVLLFFFSLYSVGRHATGTEAWLGAIGVVVVIALFVSSDGTTVGPASIAYAAVFEGAPWAAGVALRLRREREAVMSSAAEEMRVQHQKDVDRLVGAERAKIARELHDVVAHAIAVTVLQARGARAVLTSDTRAARRALDAIEHTNTQALGDMRRLLAVLRDAEEDSAPSPQPSLARLDDLLAQVRSSGLAVDLAVDGAGRELPPGVDLSAYRIIQEALTNVIKHADARRACVRLSYDEHALTVGVTDDGTSAAREPGRPVPSVTGHGLIGIRERVAVVGGEVVVGPDDGGGFQLEARLPYALDQP